MDSFKSTLICFLCSFSFITVSAQVRDSILNVDKMDDRNKKVISTKDNYLFVYDGLYDMTGSAQNLLSVSHLFGRGLDELTCNPDKNTGFNYCCDKENFLNRVLIDCLNFIFTDWLSTVQHESMGHGYRAREFNARINSYGVSSPIFGGPLGLDFHREDLPYYGLLLEETGGSESNTIFAREAFRQNLLNDYFYHYYFYSFVLKIDLDMYILGTPKVGSYEWNSYYDTGIGWDLVNYIKAFKSKSNGDEQQIYNSALKGAY